METARTQTGDLFVALTWQRPGSLSSRSPCCRWCWTSAASCRPPTSCRNRDVRAREVRPVVPDPFYRQPTLDSSAFASWKCWNVGSIIIFFNLIFYSLSRGCSAAVDHSPCDHEVKGSNLAGRWAFIFFYLFFVNFPS